MVQWSG